MPDPVVSTDSDANGGGEPAAILFTFGLLQREEVYPLDTG
jgi:hypothetical protein